jgi:hypothetical protein
MSDDATPVLIAIDAASRVNEDEQLEIKLTIIGASVLLTIEPGKFGETEAEFTNVMLGVEVMVNTFREEWLDLVKLAIQLHTGDES